MKERKALSRETFRRYRGSDRGAKTKILDEFVEATQLNRKYAVQLLKGSLRKRPQPVVARPRGRPPRYGPSMVVVLKRLWAMFGFMCGKRLACAIRVRGELGGAGGVRRVAGPEGADAATIAQRQPRHHRPAACAGTQEDPPEGTFTLSNRCHCQTYAFNAASCGLCKSFAEYRRRY